MRTYKEIVKNYILISSENQTKEIGSFQQEKKVNKLMQPRTIVKNKKNRMIEIVKKKPEE